MGFFSSLFAAYVKYLSNIFGGKIENYVGSGLIDTIREKASSHGLNINDRQSGSKLSDYLKERMAAVNQSATTAQAAPPKPQKETKKDSDTTPKAAPAKQVSPAQPEKKAQVQTTDTEELTEEEMKQLDDLLKRLEALEARMAKLESGSTAVPNTKSGKLTVAETYKPTGQENYRFTDTGVLSFGISFWYSDPLEDEYNVKKLKTYANYREEILNKNYQHALDRTSISVRGITELSDGNFYNMRFIGDTLREVRAFAALIGHKVPDKPKTEVLAAEIVREHGADAWCFHNGQALNSRGVVSSYSKLSKQDLIGYINEAYNEYHNSFHMQKPETNGKSERELVEAYMDMINSATPRELPANDEILRQFDEALRIEKLKCKQS